MDNLEWFLPLFGIFAGFVMGYASRRQRFCTMGALERYWFANDSRGLRTWMLAIAAALALTQCLFFLGWADIGSSSYVSPSLSIIGAIVGGLLFGIGMALVGTCGFGALVRIGGGSLSSAVAMVVLGLAALGAERGIMSELRTLTVEKLALDLSSAGDQSLGSFLSWLSGRDVSLITAVVVTLLLLTWVFWDQKFRKQHGSIVTGLVIGAAIAFGWFVTTFVAQHSLEIVKIQSASFVLPVGNTILHFVTNTGSIPDYGVGMVIGVILGSAACAVRQREARWESCDSAREMQRHVVGAFLMGTGGVFAGGCTIGQGVSAMSVLALSAPIALASMMIGARIGLGYLIGGSFFRSPLPRSNMRGQAPTQQPH